MNFNLKNKNCLVFDYGSYISLAVRLGRESDGFGKVFYYVPLVHNGFPTHKPYDIGRNVEGITKVDEWASVIDDVDLVCFPDVFEPALQTYFKKIGKAVFGSKYAGELEYDRVLLKHKIEELGLPINDYWVAKGVDELDSILKQEKDVYVKSSLRGDSETWNSTNYLLSRGELDRMRHDLGVYQTEETYIIESKIKSLAEIGIDTFCINGDYPIDALSGIEIKDTGYYGQIVKYNSLPQQLKKVTDKFSNIFRELKYCSFHSNEVIIGEDKKGYLLDLTQRMPSPPGDIMSEIYTNFPEIVWMVGNGLIPTLEYKYTHGVELVIKSDLAKTDASPIIVPDEYKNFVKIKNLTIDDDGVWYYSPLEGNDMREIGSVIGLGNTMREAVNMAKKIADSLEGLDIEINTDCIDKVKEQINRLKSIGIHYLD